MSFPGPHVVHKETTFYYILFHSQEQICTLLHFKIFVADYEKSTYCFQRATLNKKQQYKRSLSWTRIYIERIIGSNTHGSVRNCKRLRLWCMLTFIGCSGCNRSMLYLYQRTSRGYVSCPRVWTCASRQEVWLLYPVVCLFSWSFAKF